MKIFFSLSLSAFCLLVVPEIATSNQSYYSYAYSSSQVKHIDSEEFGRCLALTAFNYHGQMSLNRNNMMKKFNGDEFNEYLEGVSTRRFDYRSGQEQNLVKWVLQQKDASVHPYSLFKKSLELHKGNAWNAILAIHEVLRDHARFFNKTNYIIESKIDDKSATQLFNKLVDVRGDLKERGAGFEGDHRGTWYRIWGAMLYRLNSESVLVEQKKYCRPESGIIANLNSTAKDIQAHLVAVGAEKVKLLMDSAKRPRNDDRKQEFNLVGVDAMSEFIEVMKNPWSASGDVNQKIKDCNEAKYIEKGQ